MKCQLGIFWAASRIFLGVWSVESPSKKYTFNFSSNKLQIKPTVGEGDYQLTFLPKSLVGNKNTKSDTSSVNFTIKSTKDLAELALILQEIPMRKSIVQLYQKGMLKKQFACNANKLDRLFKTLPVPVLIFGGRFL